VPEVRKAVMLPKQTIPTGPIRYRLPRPSRPLLEVVKEFLADTPELSEAQSSNEPSVAPQMLHPNEITLNTPEVSAQVHQVAPRLPVKATPGSFNMYKWQALIPAPFR